MRKTTRTLAASATAALLTLTSAGCGGDDETTSTSGTPAASESESSTPSPSETATPDETDEDDSETAEFVERLYAGMGEEGAAHMVMTMKGTVSSTAEGDTAYGPDGSEARMTMTVPGMPGTTMEMLLVDGVAYMSMEGLTPPGKYFEVPADSEVMSSLTNVSPADSVEAFEAGLLRVDELGTGRIDGKAMVVYRLHLDAAATLEALGSEVPLGMPKRLVYRMWLDEDDRMRRIRYEVAGTTTVMDMTDWGKKVDLEAPAEEDLVKPPAGIA